MIRRTGARWLRGESHGMDAAVLRAMLMPLALIYGAVAWLRCVLMRPQRLPLPVISIGNLEVGGTGKSVLVRLLALRLQQRGLRVLVAARGYGAAAGHDLDEEGVELRDAGIRCVQGADRVRTIRAALDAAPADVVLLDDGAQHRRVHRDCEILLFDARRPLGSGWPLPAGSLRGFARAAPEADVVVLTRCDLADAASVSATEALMRRLQPRASVLHMQHSIAGLQPPTDLRGLRVVAVSGIARPEAFAATLRTLGAEIVAECAAGDHHAWSQSDVQQCEELARHHGAALLITTGKDDPKLRRLRREARWCTLRIEAGFPPADLTLLDAALGRALGSSASRPPVSSAASAHDA